MANYNSLARTNYFKLKDLEKYDEVCRYLVGEGVRYETTDKGAFTYGIIYGYDIDYCESPDDEDLEYSMDTFFERMKDVVAEDDAMIYTEIGNEKLCYLTAYAVIVTHDNIKSFNLNDKAIDVAKEMLKKEDWETQNSY